MRDSASPVFVGLDIGTSAVRCVIGTPDGQGDAGKPTIIGHGHATNHGMRKGVVAHVDEVSDAIVQAVTEAERHSGRQIQSAVVNINGAHVSGQDSRGVIAISGASHRITDEDRMRVEEAATIVQLPSNREIIQPFTKNYVVDGQQNIKNPVGMEGVRLEADMYLVTASSPNVQSLENTLERARLHASFRTISGLGAAQATLTRQQREVGTAVIDIGASTTSIIVFEDGEVQHVAVLPVGSNNVTNDLAIGLQTDLDIAEMVKVRYGDFRARSLLKIAHEQGEHTFEIATIRMIVDSRVEELFELVEKELHKIKRSRKLPGGIVIAGGGAKLPGIIDAAKQRLQLAVRVGKLQDVTGLVDTIDDPQFYTAIGLMQLDMYFGGQTQVTNHAQRGERSMGFIGGLLGRLRG
jgi:cell division protein FtsA